MANDLEMKPHVNTALTPLDQSTRPGVMRRAVTSRIFPLIIALAVLMIFFSIQSQYFFTVVNALNIGRQISVVLIVALGITIVLIAGEIDLSMAGVMAVCSIAAGAILQNDGANGSPVNAIITLIACLGIGLAFGLINGLFTVRFRVPSFIVTLGTLSVGTGLALSYNNGEPRAIQSIAFLDIFALGQIAGIPSLLLYPVLAFVICQILLKRTLFGVQLYSVGGNAEASGLAGVPVGRVRVLALVICSVFASLAGVILSARVQSGLPNIATGIELDAIAAAVLGGTRLAGGYGTIVGTVLGAVVIGVVSNGLTLMGIPSPAQSVVKGVVIIAAVVLDRVRNKD